MGNPGGLQALEALRDWLSAGRHFPVRIQELLPGLLAYGIGQFGRLVTATEFCGLHKHETPPLGLGDRKRRLD